ncbi:MAG: DegT/DnrJ/EryC1/StrS aminotransferase family protein [Gammaproteobacteria bacterium]|nr:DegT/DnrJ/EryC1/StrS aminotransferase family protein [Gammaproteobacteria bacterium]
MPATEPLPFNDLQAQRRRIAPAIERALHGVLEHGLYINGPEVARLEEELAAFCGARHVVACSSGTDALVLALLALRIGAGDAVFVPAFTFAATAEAVALVGATPVFVDIDPRYALLDPAGIEAAIVHVGSLGLRPRAIIPVDLYGQPADYIAINAIAARHGMAVIADAAQSFGAMLAGRPVGQLAPITVTSFFPAKPFGCYGDGGAVITADGALAEALRSLREHGRGAARYDHQRIGLNARLDTLQAAILLEKLAIFADEIEQREQAARRYTAGLRDVVATPEVGEGNRSVWAQYTIRVADREGLAQRLHAVGVPTAVHYPCPVARQPAYRQFPIAPAGIGNAERWSAMVLSLPLHAYLDAATQQRIITAVRTALGD